MYEEMRGRIKTIHEQQRKEPEPGACTCPYAILCKPVDEEVVKGILKAVAKKHPCPIHHRKLVEPEEKEITDESRDEAINP